MIQKKGGYINKNLSLIIAALNEEKLISSTVKAAVTSCLNCLDNFELILVNDGSTDRTGEIMEQICKDLNNVTVIHHSINQGLGAALQHGVKIAKYEYVMLLCGDGGLPGESLPPILSAIGQADLIIPYMSNFKKIKTPFRFYLSKIYTKLFNLIFGQKLNYYNGLPVYKTEMLRNMKIISKGFAVQAEVIIKLLKSGCSYIQIETLGAEGSDRVAVVTMKGCYEVAKILIYLILDVFFLKRNES